jgi:formate hydrogenlyase subunit 6/NADH:ubiquinone oxidoreductase subunit I
MEGELLASVTRKASTIAYPKRKQPPVDGLRGRIMWHIDTCIGCGLCPQACPTDAILMTGKSARAEITYFLNRCIYCGDCITICPTHSIVAATEYELAFTDQKHMVIHYRRTLPSSED